MERLKVRRSSTQQVPGVVRLGSGPVVPFGHALLGQLPLPGHWAGRANTPLRTPWIPLTHGELLVPEHWTGSPDSAVHMISWPGGSGVYPKRSIQCLSANLSHLYTHSARKKGQWKRIGTHWTYSWTFWWFPVSSCCAWCLEVRWWVSQTLGRPFILWPNEA